MTSIFWFYFVSFILWAGWDKEDRSRHPEAGITAWGRCWFCHFEGKRKVCVLHPQDGARVQLSRLHHTKAGRIKGCQGKVKYGVFVESKLQGPQVVQRLIHIERIFQAWSAYFFLTRMTLVFSTVLFTMIHFPKISLGKIGVVPICKNHSQFILKKIACEKNSHKVVKSLQVNGP